MKRAGVSDSGWEEAGRRLFHAQDRRLPAINLYLQLGFRPLLSDADDAVRESWRMTLGKLGRVLPEGSR